MTDVAGPTRRQRRATGGCADLADDQLVLALAAARSRGNSGDTDLLVRELYRRYHRPLYTFVLTRMRDRQAAEDVVQEAFLRLWREAARFDPQRGSVAALLFTVARNLVTDAHRREGRHVTAMERVACAHRAHAGADDDAVATAIVTTVAVAGALGAVRPAQRRLLGMVYWADAPHRDVAETLGVPVGTVKSRHHHALRSLQVALGGMGIG